MTFLADLHIHSRFSRATAKNCDLEHLALWAQKKGLSVVGTGDFTHPGWRAEIEEHLVQAEPGLLRLAPDLERAVERKVPASCRAPVRFMLSVEIATIYKRAEKTRKVHHVVFAPDLDAAGCIVDRLGKIGNLNSDGRPILGLDSRDLLEIVLEAGEGCYLVPAHVWTPWFAVLGSKSGFDRIEDCYLDLSDHIFALETGLSSDPPMNWRVSSLDRYRLVSNSDAHSPAKLGREATAFDCPMDYHSMERALRGGDGFCGTVEFFPEEGKYHLDGHRKCSLSLEPEQTRAAGGRCPSCGGLLTVGVVHRVEELADRTEAEATRAPPATAGEVRSLVPLVEILSEILGVGSGSQRVQKTYEGLVDRLGPELGLLWDVDLEEVRRAASPLVAEALGRLRSGQVVRQAGYDGEYGVIRLFSKGELERDQRSMLLFAQPPDPTRTSREVPGSVPGASGESADPFADKGSPRQPVSTTLDADQRAALECDARVVAVVAGPGTGKTRVLTERITHLVDERGLHPGACLAITFTRRAADELRNRLTGLLARGGERVRVMTLHGLGLEILRAHASAAGLRPDFLVSTDNQRLALLVESQGLSERSARALLRRISAAKRSGDSLSGGDERSRRNFEQLLRERNLIDFDDLVVAAADLLESHLEIASEVGRRIRSLSIDEAQDMDVQQHRLVGHLVGEESSLFAIGDPDQAIYGFRGADPDFVGWLQRDFRGVQVLGLRTNYRSSRSIVDGARQVIRASDGVEREIEALLEHPERIGIHAASTDKSEAEFVVQSLERMIGGHSFFSIDSGRSTDGRVADLGFSDFAVLYRTDAQADLLIEALERSGLPYQKCNHGKLIDVPGVLNLADALRVTPGKGDLRRRLKIRMRRLQTEAASGGPSEQELQRAYELVEPLAKAHGADTPGFLCALTLGAEVDVWSPKAERISLLTLHAAKGLEFPVVFVTGCEDGVLPLRFGTIDLAAEAEERRLFYVGMTRASRHLLLCRAMKRKWRGKVRRMAASPFLLDIEERLTEAHRSGLAGKTRRDGKEQLGLL